MFLFMLSCKAQIINIKDQGSYMYRSQGQYYKDINNLLDPFVGTWLYTDGNKQLKIILTKKIDHNNGVYSEDILVGGYQYIVDNEILVDTLNEINGIYLNSILYPISGNRILENNYNPPCNDCNIGEKRLSLSFSEPASNLKGILILRKKTINGLELLELDLEGSHSRVLDPGDSMSPDDFVLPSGHYELAKQ